MENKNQYSSGSYYQEVYVPAAFDLKLSTKWMENYFHVLKNIYPNIENCKEKKILEIGSSFGGFVNLLKNREFKHITASDMSSELFPQKIGVNFIKFDLLDIGSLEKSFDLIFAFDVMEHINDTETAVRNIFKILNEGGMFIFSTPYPIKKHLMDKYHTNMQFPNFYSNILKQNGFELVAIQDISFVPYVWRLKIPMFLKSIVKNGLFISETFFVFKKI